MSTTIDQLGLDFNASQRAAQTGMTRALPPRDDPWAMSFERRPPLVRRSADHLEDIEDGPSGCSIGRGLPQRSAVATPSKARLTVAPNPTLVSLYRSIS